LLANPLLYLKYVKERTQSHATFSYHYNSWYPVVCSSLHRVTEIRHKQPSSILSRHIHHRHGWRFFIEYALRPKGIFDITKANKARWKKDLPVIVKDSKTGDSKVVRRIRRLTIQGGNASDLNTITNPELIVYAYRLPNKESWIDQLQRWSQGIIGEPDVISNTKWSKIIESYELMSKVDTSQEIAITTLPEAFVRSSAYLESLSELNPKLTRPFDILFTIEGHENAYLPNLDDPPLRIPLGYNYIIIIFMTGHDVTPTREQFFASLSNWHDISIEYDTTYNLLKRKLRRKAKTNAPIQDEQVSAAKTNLSRSLRLSLSSRCALS
jgi:hypothetical protein